MDENLKLVSNVVALTILLSCQPVFGQRETLPGNGIERLQPRAAEAIDRGLTFLSSRQNEDGSFGTGSTRNNQGINAIIGMAYLSVGHTPHRGKHAERVNRCLSYILKNAQDSGYIDHPEQGTHGPMYGHGFATLFLAEAYGMTPRPDLRDKLSKAVRLIVNSQNSEGGWRYVPDRREADLSVTISQIMALRSARNAGIFVPNETIDRCIEYVKRSQNPDGGFMYMLSQPGDSQFARSAAGIAALQSAGIYDTEEVRRGITYLRQQKIRGDTTPQDRYFFYGHYYAVQAMWQVGGDPWNQWYREISGNILSREIPDGGWMDGISTDYATAMACLILQTPQSYLPIFQR